MISLRKRFTIWSLGATVLLAALAGFSLYFYVRAALYRDFDAGLQTRAQLIGSLLRIEDNGQYGMDFSDESMPEYLPGRRPEYFQVVTPDGKTLERSKSLKAQNLAVISAIHLSAEPWNLILPNGRPGRALSIYAQPHPDSDDHDRLQNQEYRNASHLAPAIVIVAQDRSQINHALEPLLSALLIGGSILAIGSIFMVQFVVGQALKPINELAQQAENVGSTNLDYRFDIAALPAELQLICQRLNELLVRLDQAFSRERRLNADIAHELRTPIAELRSLTDVACRWPTDAAQSAEYFNDAHAIAVKMGSLIDTLLTLARARANIVPCAIERIGLNEIIEDALSSHRDEIMRRRLNVTIKLPSNYQIETNCLMFGRMIDNVIANAVDYAAEDGRIECKSECIDSQCKLTVGNSNDSLTAQDITNMFDSFWRKDVARADSEHTGLGLTLVAEYAAQLGILVTAHLRSPQWFEITLKLPRNTNSDASPGLAHDNVAHMTIQKDTTMMKSIIF